MNGQEKGSAAANTVSQKAELVFNTGAAMHVACGLGLSPSVRSWKRSGTEGDILQIQEIDSIILIQSIDSCLKLALTANAAAAC